METNLNTLSDNIVNWIKNYAINNKISCLVVGVSGGVDSGLVSTLCAKTMLPTYIVSMPIHQESEQLKRARNHCEWLVSNFQNVTFIEKDLTQTFETFKSLFDDKFNEKIAFANTRSRLRMITLYQIAGSVNGIVVGTGNKVEDFGIGFYTKYGDGGVDISPIADLKKTEVREMSKIMGLPEYIVNAKPTDGLWEDNRSDEDQIGASYEELEKAMEFLGNINELNNREKTVYSIYQKFNIKNKHKMVPIPVYIKK